MAEQSFTRSELPLIETIEVPGMPRIEVHGKPSQATSWVDVRAPASPTPSEAAPAPLAPDWQPVSD